MVLGDVEAAVGWLEWGIDPRSTGDSCSLASQGLQAVLDVAFSTPEPSRKKVCEQGIARDHFPHGLREQDMGRAPNSWELKMLGFDLSERTVQRWMRKAPTSPEPARRWAAFLSNHREAIAAMDFFTVPTLSFGVLYCFFVLAHDRRRILHCNATNRPTSAWVVQQLREAFPYDSAPKYLIFDRGANFNEEVIDTVKSFGIQPTRTSFRSPWQNGV